ncbi:MAG: hypothetical protein EBT51_09420 [Flavobacteriaceae bacterium]|jgi:uncharacterized membrane protein|nr:hypothetical protein [Flavobacteriaceae bacterium]
MNMNDYYEEGQQTMNMLVKLLISNVLIVVSFFLLPNKWYIIPLMLIIPIIVFTTIRSRLR